MTVPLVSARRSSIWLLGLALCLIVAIPARAGNAGDGGAMSMECKNPQSPRIVDPKADPSPYQLAADNSIVGEIGADSIVYLPRLGGPPLTLYRCGQHYHLPIETPQGCEGEAAGAEVATPPPPGTRVEFHTVFAANQVAPPNCDPETLGCCTDPPFLVRAFSATVTAGGEPGPVEVPTGRPLAEWSGSTTGKEDPPGSCKFPAQWSFRLGCDYTVSEAQMKQFKHADPARPVQTGDRISRELTLVGP